ncbi:MAG TPA: hypothetical protein VEY93_11620 [Longimicrobium sp.]|nr:hypothetical protein [Longimicrobium sp.]
MRDTSYARELKTVALPSGDSEVRIERLYVKEAKQEEIRFSWWRDGKMMMRPLDLPEDELIQLLELAIKENVFKPDFIAELKRILP